MSFWEPTKYFDWLLDIEDKYVSDEEWNRASQDERERMLQPVIDEYMNQHGSETDWGEFFDDLEDNNCHTEFRLFHERLAKRGSRCAEVDGTDLRIHGWLEGCVLKLDYKPTSYGWGATIYDVDGSVYEHQNGFGKRQDALSWFYNKFDGCWIDDMSDTDVITSNKHAKSIKRAMSDTVTFSNHFAVDVEVNVDISQYIDEYPEDFGCNSGDEVLEKIEDGDLDDDEIISIIGANLYRFVYTETYINDSVGVESEFEIADVSANDFYDDWEEV